MSSTTYFETNTNGSIDNTYIDVPWVEPTTSVTYYPYYHWCHHTHNEGARRIIKEELEKKLKDKKTSEKDKMLFKMIIEEL